MKTSMESYADRLTRVIDSGRFLDETEFNALAFELFAFQFQHNRPFHHWCQSLNRVPGTVEHWSRIPAVPATAFKQDSFTVLPPEMRRFAFYSSGTTAAARSRHHHSAESMAVYEASLRPWFARHLLDRVSTPQPSSPDITLISLTPAAADAPNSSLAHMIDCVGRQAGGPRPITLGRVVPDGSWDLDTIAAESVLRRMAESGRPVCLLGTAFLFVVLLDDLRARDVALALPQGSRIMETGGYKGRTRQVPKPELYAWMEGHLGIGDPWIVGEYGMSELSSQAYDRVAGSTVPRAFHFPPWARARVVSPETGREVAEGEAGLIEIVDLANVASSLAVRTEDLALRRRDGFELLGRAAVAEPRGCSLMTP